MFRSLVLWRSYSNTAVSSAVSLKREITFSSYGPKSRRYLQVLSALTARMGLTQDLITPFQKAFTFKSSASESSQNNKNFIEIGKAIINFQVTQYVYIKYPNLFANGISSIVNAYEGKSKLSEIGLNLGVDGAILCEPNPDEDREKVVADAVSAIVGALYSEKGVKEAKEWVNNFILADKVDEKGCMNFPNPKPVLKELTKLQGKEEPIARMIKETGRYSHASMYLVGMFSGNELLGKGHGKSISEAETLAAKNALVNHFYKEVSETPQIDENGNVLRLKIGLCPPDSDLTKKL